MAEPTARTYELPAGTVLDKYEILRKIETGGMAEIYLARARGTAGFEKIVVLKRILPNIAEDPAFVKMFLDEARLAATLQHPNIADVYDVGEVDGTYFFTMEFVHGQDVRMIRGATRKANEPVPLAIVLAIVHGIASALDYAHGKTAPDGQPLGLVHRDVSPSNIIVSYDGAVKLLDFGIARAASSQHKTQTGTLKGKIPYMSPEQCKGFPLDRRSDLFSLGVVFYELTVGRRPFRGDSEFMIMDQIVHQGAPPPRQVQSSYPEEVEAIVMRLLHRNPNERFATSDELIHALDELIAKHQLWVSPKALGKYMRMLFADRIAAWEEALQQGVPFTQHVARTITSQSQRSELETPPSAFPGLPPRTSQMQAAEATPHSVAAYPSLRRSRRWLWIALVALVVTGGGIAADLMLAGGARKPSPANDVQMTSTAPMTTPPRAVTPPEPATKPTPVAEPTVREPTVREPTEKPTPVVPTAVKPAVKPPVRHVAKPPPATATKPKPKPEPNKPEQEPTWDPNSPYLPQ